MVDPNAAPGSSAAPPAGTTGQHAAPAGGQPAPAAAQNTAAINTAVQKTESKKEKKEKKEKRRSHVPDPGMGYGYGNVCGICRILQWNLTILHEVLHILPQILPHPHTQIPSYSQQLW